MSSVGLRMAVPAVTLVAVCSFWYAGRVAAQTATPAVTWEYATVEAHDQYNTGSVRYNSANVCYHTPNGCRWETTRVTVDRWSQTNDAVAAATARLGTQGWEVVATTAPTEFHRTTVTLKRARPAQQPE
jgi:hypothetical protein